MYTNIKDQMISQTQEITMVMKKWKTKAILLPKPSSLNISLS